MFENLFDKVVDTVEDFVEDPIGTSTDIITQPAKDALEVVEGLTEGQLREKAALRLGADVASGMVLSELIEWYND